LWNSRGPETVSLCLSSNDIEDHAQFDMQVPHLFLAATLFIPEESYVELNGVPNNLA